MDVMFGSLDRTSAEGHLVNGRFHFGVCLCPTTIHADTLKSCNAR